MADKPKGGSKPKPKAVSREEFNELSNGVSELVGLVKEVLQRPAPLQETPAEIKEKTEAAKAVPNKYTVNPDWEDLAREIIGEGVDHTEVQYVKGGGLMFTVVIKEEFSNAPADYLERYKVDRRSKEVGAEGEAGVRIWCEQIRNNLKKPKQVASGE